MAAEAIYFAAIARADSPLVLSKSDGLRATVNLKLTTSSLIGFLLRIRMSKA
jgi:hypothetical protein